jgi:hypothetical protein
LVGFEVTLYGRFWVTPEAKSRHTWFLFEAVNRRVSKSLSDLDGTDPYIHDQKPKGPFRELGNALVRSADQPTVAQMYGIYRQIKMASPLIIQNAGAKSLFEARVFRQLVVLARKYVELGRTSFQTER